MSKSLCHRCEHRANFLETGTRLLWECTSYASTVESCHKYWPVQIPALNLPTGAKGPDCIDGGYTIKGDG